jgi:short-subunit dehydrogenase
MKDLAGRMALVTGASSGLGAAFARQLAARGADVVLVARRMERLTALASELEAAHGVRARSLACDLAAPEAVGALVRELDEQGLAPDILVNNAGAGVQECLMDTEWPAVHGQIQLNVTSLIQLTHVLAVRMRARGRGHILNVASIGAYVPVPGYAVYAAAKAFVLHFSEAIAHELGGSGVRVCCLSPGGIDTEFFQAAGQSVAPWMRLALMSPERCARIGLSALFGCRRSVVSGYGNTLGMFLTRFLPRWLMIVVAGAFMGKRAPALGA